jgi:hypothetical protein
VSSWSWPNSQNGAKHCVCGRGVMNPGSVTAVAERHGAEDDVGDRGFGHSNRLASVSMAAFAHAPVVQDDGANTCACFRTPRITEPSVSRFDRDRRYAPPPVRGCGPSLHYDPDGRVIYPGRAVIGISAVELGRSVTTPRVAPYAVGHAAATEKPLWGVACVSHMHWVRPNLIAKVKFLIWDGCKWQRRRGKDRPRTADGAALTRHR